MLQKLSCRHAPLIPLVIVQWNFVAAFVVPLGLQLSSWPPWRLHWLRYPIHCIYRRKIGFLSHIWHKSPSAASFRISCTHCKGRSIHFCRYIFYGRPWASSVANLRLTCVSLPHFHYFESCWAPLQSVYAIKLEGCSWVPLRYCHHRVARLMQVPLSTLDGKFSPSPWESWGFHHLSQHLQLGNSPTHSSW